MRKKIRFRDFFKFFSGSPISAENDWLNVHKTRNSANTAIADYNCGGYCLGTYSWYNPYSETYDAEGYEDMVHWVEDMYLDWKISIEEIYDELMRVAAIQIEKDFKDTVRITKNPYDINDGEKLVVYKVGLVFFRNGSDTEYLEHADFHFKQWEGDHWSDKPGMSPLRKQYLSMEEVINDPWINSWWDGKGYDSPPLFLAVRKS